MNRFRRQKASILEDLDMLLAFLRLCKTRMNTRPGLEWLREQQPNCGLRFEDPEARLKTDNEKTPSVEV